MAWLILAAAVYLLPAVVLLLDETLFQSQMYLALGPGSQTLVQKVYWPVITLLNYLD